MLAHSTSSWPGEEEEPTGIWAPTQGSETATHPRWQPGQKRTESGTAAGWKGSGGNLRAGIEIPSHAAPPLLPEAPPLLPEAPPRPAPSSRLRVAEPPRRFLFWQLWLPEAPAAAGVGRRLCWERWVLEEWFPSPTSKKGTGGRRVSELQNA